MDKSLRDFLGDMALEYHGKGGLGQLVEKHVFGYEPNSNAHPDFPIAGVELKTTPMKESEQKKSLIAKERLVLNIINYETEWKLSFRNSSFWHKNEKILLMFYLHEKDKLPIDYIFKIVYLWRFPIKDLKIIKDDWQTIMQKVKDGKAHEITEGDTLYLAACTKGSTKEKSKRHQPFADELAQQRAFSLKPLYMNSIINECLPKMEIFKDGNIELHYPQLQHEAIDPDELNWVIDDWSSSYVSESLEAYKIRQRKTQAIIKDIHDIDPQDTFLNFVERKFKPYFGKEDKAIEATFGIDYSTPKNRHALITRAILGITDADAEIEEFVKSGIEVKTIRLEQNGRLKEAMSFKQIQYKQIINEDWGDSYWYETLNKKFLFVVYQKNDAGNYNLRTAFFWNMPCADLQVAHDFWEDTKAKISNGDFDHFIKSSDNMICHVRPKARDSHDLMETADGSMQKKKCFWLNRDYILKVVQANLLSQAKEEQAETNNNDS